MSKMTESKKPIEIKDVEKNILIKISTNYPCSYTDLYWECMTQVINFETIPITSRSLIIDEALNNLLKDKKISIKSVYWDSEDRHNKYDFEIVFFLY